MIVWVNEWVPVFLIKLTLILEMFVFDKRVKLDYLEKNLLEQRREPTTNLAHMQTRINAFAMLSFKKLFVLKFSTMSS